jgi:hypothetical protein
MLQMLIAFAVGSAAGAAGAAAPELLSYQGVLLQNSSVAVPNGVYSLRFRLFDHATAGTIVFEQTLSAQVTSGLYNVVLSNNDPYDLGDVVSANTQLFMEVTVLAAPPAVPSNITLLPRQQLASVPYALGAPVPPGIFRAPAPLVHTNASNAQTTLNAWTPVAALEGLALEVPSADCVLEIRAEVVLAAPVNDRAVGARIEQKIGSESYAAVRGPVSVSVGNGRPSTAVVSYVVENPAAGSYAYRVATREDGDQAYIVSPTLGFLGSESTLSGRLWCP